VDVCFVTGALYFCAMFYGIRWTVEYTAAGVAGALAITVAFSLVAVYRPWHGTTFFREVLVIAQGLAITVTVLLICAWAIKETSTYSRVVVGLWFIVSFLGIMFIHWLRRILAARWRSSRQSRRRAVIIGAGKLGMALAARLQQDWIGVTVVGFFDDDPDKQVTSVMGLSVLGNTRSAVETINEQNIELVYIALPFRVDKKIKQLIEMFEDTPATVYVAPDLFLFDKFNALWFSVDGIPVVTRSESPFVSTASIVKRIEDITFATLFLILLSPVLVLIAVWVRFSSPGPAIYKQMRCGINGEPIVVWKFRTMTAQASNEKYKQAEKGDYRLTSCGRFLRKHSLDELPQFFNILEGKLSLVGPRPHPPALDEQYQELNKSQIWRRKVRPGITGWAQVHGLRGETEEKWMMEKRLEYDLYYIDNWSVLLDLKIVFLTIPHLFGNPRAY
jgi:putative colanic acid biosynthesis UDP-glucose lipid carrier transferase